MPFRPLRPDLWVSLLCYFCAFALLASPIIPYEFSPTQLWLFTIITGTPLAALGIYLNHLAANSPKKQ